MVDHQMTKLYIVATPIGNRGDLSVRALEVLQQVDLIVAEDTRHTKQLLAHFGVSQQMLSFHQYNENQRSEKLIALLESGKSIALVADAGTPLISDPGYPLVAAAHQKNIPVVPVPGACAAIAALCASGLAATEFLFVGFLPPKGEKRDKRLRQLVKQRVTVVLYESVHRIMDLLNRMLPIFGEQRRICLARELTKKYETILTAPLIDVLATLSNNATQQKGEFVLLIAGDDAPSNAVDAEAEHTLKILLEELPLKQAVRLTKHLTGKSHRLIYQCALQLQSG